MAVRRNSLIIAGGVLAVGAAAYHLGFSAGHEAGLADAPVYAEAVAEQAAADRAWLDRLDAEPSDEERTLDEIVDLVRPFVLDGLAPPEPASDDRR